MNLGLMGLGAGSAVGGTLLSELGQAQGNKAMAKIQRQRMRELHDLQNQGIAKTEQFVNANNPGTAITGATQAQNALAQSELAKLGAAGGAISSADLNSVMDNQAQQAQVNGLNNYRQQTQSNLQGIQNDQSALQQLADQRNAYYDTRQQGAAMKGQGLRTLGGLVNLGGSGLFTLGSLVHNSRNNPTAFVIQGDDLDETPRGGWAANQRGYA